MNNINNDLISRQQAVDALETVKTVKAENGELYIAKINAQMKLEILSSVQPEQHLDEWCVDCKEYDKEKHSCPRWNRVIRQTLLDAQPKRKTGHWIKTARWGRVYYCDQCRNYLDFDGVNAGRGSTNFCPNCGADMRGEQNGTEK